MSMFALEKLVSQVNVHVCIRDACYLINLSTFANNYPYSLPLMIFEKKFGLTLEIP